MSNLIIRECCCIVLLLRLLLDSKPGLVLFCSNYYVFESTLKEGAGEEEEVPEEEEEGSEGEGGGEGEEESGESKKKKGGWGRPSDGIPMEEGIGTNANVYWVCHRPGDQYKKLPPVTPLQINTARQLKKFLTGNLEVSMLHTKPPRPISQLPSSSSSSPASSIVFMCVEFFRIAIVELILDPAIQWIQWVSWCVWSFLHNCDCGANLKPCNTISLLHVCEVFFKLWLWS